MVAASEVQGWGGGLQAPAVWAASTWALLWKRGLLWYKDPRNPPEATASEWQRREAKSVFVETQAGDSCPAGRRPPCSMMQGSWCLPPVPLMLSSVEPVHGRPAVSSPGARGPPPEQSDPGGQPPWPEPSTPSPMRSQPSRLPSASAQLPSRSPAGLESTGKGLVSVTP